MLTTLTNTNVAFADLKDGLVAYYPFNGNANDESGNGNNGTVYGATLTTDRFGNTNKAYSFDGVDDYIDSKFNFNGGSTNFTISYWAKFYSLSGKIFHFQENTDGLPEINNDFWDTKLNFYLRGTTDDGDSENGITTYSTMLSTNLWYHVTSVFVFSNQTKKIYLNGELVLSKVSILSIDRLPNSEVRIGARLNNSEYLNGVVDDIRIYNRALSDSEIQELYNEGSSATPTPTATPTATLVQTPTPTPTVTATVTFTPTPSETGIVFGYVYDEDENPLRGVTVKIDDDDYSDSGTTDEDGYYEFDKVPSGDYTITYTKTGYESGSQSVTVTANAVTTANFELTPESTPVLTGAIAGTVLDSETGIGISGATVSTDSGGYSATTDARGSYRIQNVPTGSYTLTAEAEGYEGESETVTVTANALSTVNFSLEPSGSKGTAIVFGSVEDEYGDYFQGVDVTISGAGYSDETETDEYGDYELYEVPAGSYTITFEAKGYETQSVKITVDAGDEYEVDTARMEPEGEDLGLIYGYVYDIEGEPVEDVKITAKYISTGAKEKVYTDRGGFFEFEDMEPGTYKVSTKKKGYKKDKETITLKSEQEKYVEFELRESSRSRLITAMEEMFGY